MDFDIQFNFRVFRSEIRRTIERRVQQMEQLTGGVVQIPFDLVNSLDREPAVVNHIEFADEDVTIGPATGSMDRSLVTIALPTQFPFGSASPLSSTQISVTQMLLSVAARVFFVRVTDLVTSGRTPTPRHRMLEVRLRTNYLIVQPPPPEPEQTTFEPGLRFLSLDVGIGSLFRPIESLPEGFQAELMMLEDLFSRVAPTLNISLRHLLNVLNRDSSTTSENSYRLVNWGIRARNDITTIRIQVKRGIDWGFPEMRIRHWSQFYDLPNAVTYHLAGNDWAMFMPKEYITNRVHSAIEAAFASRSDLLINADNQPRTDWIVRDESGAGIASGCVAGGSLQPVTRFSIKAPGACIPWGYDIDANIRLDLSIEIVRKHDALQLRVSIFLNHSVDEGDAAFCTFLNATLVGGGGAVIGATFGGWVGAIVGGIIGNLSGGIATLAVIYSRSPGRIDSLEPLRDEHGSPIENAYFMDVTLQAFQSDLFGWLEPSNLIACTNGLAIGGRIGSRGENRLRLLSELPALDPFTWRVRDASCPIPPQRATVHAYTEIRLAHGIVTAGTFPLRIWHTQILDSRPPNIATTLVVSSDRTEPNLLKPEFSLTTLQRLREEAAADAPYFTLLIQTNAGARILHVEVSGPSLTESKHDELQDLFERDCASRAALLEGFENYVRRLREIFAEPLVPLPEPLPGDIWRWDITLIGGRPGAQIELGMFGKQSSFEMLETFKVDELGRLRLVLYRLGTEEALYPTAISISDNAFLNNNQKASHTLLTSDIHIAVKRYQEIASIPVIGTYRDHALGFLGNALRLAIASDQGIMVGRLFSGSVFLNEYSQSTQNIERIVIDRDRIMAWGATEGWQGDQIQGWARMDKLALERTIKAASHTKQALSKGVLDKLRFHLGCCCRRRQNSERKLAASSVAVQQSGDLLSTYDNDRQAILILRLTHTAAAQPRSA